MLRPSVAAFAFDEPQFAELCDRFRAGKLRPQGSRLAKAPRPLPASEVEHATRATAEGIERAKHAIAQGKIAVVILNGGMATRFGGEAKGCVSVADEHPDTFLSIKLGQVRDLARRLDARIPTVLMHSFATAEASEAHLAEIDWAGIASADRGAFHQSIMPRIDSRGQALAVSAGPDARDTDLYAAPGHGDTLRMFRQSGTASRLRELGVEHVLVSNVDNLGASLDLSVLALHLERHRQGCGLTVEVVVREPGDTGGCVARHEGRDIIVEAFRLPEDASLADYPHFNTNTLWFGLDAMDREFDLTWFAVEKQVSIDSRPTTVIQFEQLIGQATEFLASRYVEVSRRERFVPIKTRQDLVAARARMLDFIADVRAGSPTRA